MFIIQHYRNLLSPEVDSQNHRMWLELIMKPQQKSRLLGNEMDHILFRGQWIRNRFQHLHNTFPFILLI